MDDATRSSNPKSSTGFEWLMGALAVLLIGGLDLDIWAHSHGKVDQSFFTPWHAVLYGAMALNGIVLGIVMANNVLRRGYPWRRALPEGYGLSLVGVISFAICGALDLAWHTLFGIEEDIQALLSPTHLLLATSAALILTGPLRSAAFRFDASARAGWRALGPMVLSICAVLTLLGLFSQFAHPMIDVFGMKTAVQPVYNSIYITRVDGTSQTRLTVDPSSDDWGAAASPDGKRIVYRRADPSTGASDLYVADLDGAHVTRLTHSGRHDTQPAWSPDGRFIVYVSSPANTSGDYSLDVVSAHGGPVRTLTSGSATLDGPSWSPDGSTIAFGSRHSERSWIALIRAAGGATTWPTAGVDGSWPAWSPDGKTIAFALDFGSGTASIYTMDAAGVAAKRISPLRDGNDLYPAWSSDGTKIAYSSDDRGASQVFVMRSDGSPLSDATRNAGLDAVKPSWTRNGELIFSGTGNARRDNSQNQGFGIGSVLLQTILTMGFLLLIVRRFRPPAGAMTVVLLFNALAMVIVSDQYFLLLGVLAAGIIVDIKLAVLGARAADGFLFYAFAFGTALLLTACYEATVAWHSGLGWPPNIILGAPVLAGVAGLLLAFAFRPPLANGPVASV
jgi:Tol biopolymer transport system component